MFLKVVKTFSYQLAHVFAKNKLESHSPNDALCQVCMKFALKVFFLKLVYEWGQLVCMDSRSRKEGFGFNVSDMGVINWPNDHRVLWDFSQAALYNTHTDIH